MIDIHPDPVHLALLRFIAGYPRCETSDVAAGVGRVCPRESVPGHLTRLQTSGLLMRVQAGDDPWGWTLTATGTEVLAAHRPVKRLVIGRRMRAAVAYVAKHEGCTKYAAGKAVTRPGHQRDGWVIVQRCIDAGLISARKHRDGTTALSVTEAGWVS